MRLEGRLSLSQRLWSAGPSLATHEKAGVCSAAQLAQSIRGHNGRRYRFLVVWQVDPSVLPFWTVFTCVEE
jgi:hypothetical protein